MTRTHMLVHTHAHIPTQTELPIQDYATARSRTHLKKIPAQLFGDILPLMGPEDSLPCSRQPTTGLYPEPEESSFYPGTLFL